MPRPVSLLNIQEFRRREDFFGGGDRIRGQNWD